MEWFQLVATLGTEEQRVCGGLSKDGAKRGYERREAHVAGRGRWHAVASSAGRVVASSD
jgi:hypothetical protein